MGFTYSQEKTHAPVRRIQMGAALIRGITTLGNNRRSVFRITAERTPDCAIFGSLSWLMSFVANVASNDEQYAKVKQDHEPHFPGVHSFEYPPARRPHWLSLRVH